MALFFVPAGVGIVNALDILSQYWQAVLVACAVSTVVVIVVGIFGGLVGPFILERLGIKSRIARGLALGSAAHGLGTAKAMELGAVEGAICGLAIGVTGIMTAISVPVIELFIA